MNDPHVRRLHYEVRVPELVHFETPLISNWGTPEGNLTISGNEASIELVNHYAIEDEARVAVQPHLAAWEIWAGLTCR